MQIRAITKGFTLIELIIVIIIMGLVATLVSSRMGTFAEHSLALTPETIKKYLIAVHSHKPLHLFCYDHCSKCDLWEGEKRVRSALRLEHEGALHVMRFDRFGRLIFAEPAIHRENGVMREGNFEFFLYPDGKSSALILASKEKILAYTPLGEQVIKTDEEQLQNLLFNPALLNKDNYYGNR